MQSQHPDYAEIRARVLRRWRKRALFITHTVIFVIAAIRAPRFDNDIGPIGYERLWELWLLVLVFHGIIAFDLWSKFVDHLVPRMLRPVIRRWQNRALFITHVALYLAVTALLKGQRTSEFVPFDLLWLSVLALHAIYTFAPWRGFIDRRVQREINKMQYEKPKREQALQLADDGELVFESDNSTSQVKLKRNNLNRRI